MKKRLISLPFTKKHYSEIGRKGGNMTKAKYGRDYFRKIARKSITWQEALEKVGIVIITS